jgi:hypothetical protein
MTTGKSIDFEGRIHTLSDELEKQNKRNRSKTFNKKYIWYVSGGLIPVVIGSALYFIQPKFVQEKTNGGYVKNNKKIAMWTVGLTILLWAMMAGYYYYSHK